MKVPLFSINLALVGTMVFLVWDTTNTWLFTTDVPVEESSAIITKQQEPEQESEQKKKRKHLRYYAMIGKNNLFRPEREEWKAPPPPPPPKKPEAPPPPPEPEAPPPPPPLPNPTLDGIIILSETNKIALMKGSHREGGSSNADTPAQPTSNSRRPPRIRRPFRPVSSYGRIVTEEVKRYHIGDEVSEMTVENILEDHVVLKRTSGEKVEIFLRTEEKTAKQVASGIQAKTPPPRNPVTKKPPSRRSSRFRRRSSRRPTRLPAGAQ